jgi:hypothetical protein
MRLPLALGPNMHRHQDSGDFADSEMLEPTEGVEPTTGGLQNRCSTVELRRRRARF